jgi:uncharacterized protein GlcG (DUF336 family)
MTQNESKQSWPPDLPYFSAGMNLEKAVIMIEAAIKRAQKMTLSFTMAVCDAGGNLVALQKMDEAPLLSLEIAINKARTAVYGKVPTGEWGANFKGAEPVLSPLWFHSGWITFPGGFPVIVEGKVIGGLGCSGATWEDSLVARAGLAAIGADTKGADEFLKGCGVPPEDW